MIKIDDEPIEFSTPNVEKFAEDAIKLLAAGKISNFTISGYANTKTISLVGNEKLKEIYDILELYKSDRNYSSTSAWYDVVEILEKE